MDETLRQSLLEFLKRVSAQHAIAAAYLFGSRARGEATPDSDADLAIVLRGVPGSPDDFWNIKLALSDLSFDLLLETGILIQAIPLWENEWEQPSLALNPSLLRNIRREGIPL